MMNIVVEPTFTNLISEGFARINAKGKVIINRKYFNSLERYEKTGFRHSVKALERSLVWDKLLSQVLMGNSRIHGE